MAPPASAQAPANIRVLVRVRPLNRKELIERGSAGRTNVLNLDTSSKGEIDFNGEIKENGATISVNNTSDLNRRMTSGDYRAGYTSDGDMNNANGGSSKQYMFDAVHGERSTQSEVYESVKGIVDAVVDGYNGTIVAYGQTGSGKTHTVFGSSERGDDAEAGLVHRSLRDIFNKIALAQAEAATSEDEQRQNSKTTFRGSFFEIFNERVYDLLALNTLHKALAVRENSNGVYVDSLKEVEVKNTSDAQSLLARGLANRHVASTNMNRTSSRSHAVFVLNVRTEHTTSEGLRKVRHSKFTLVDLAGSERQKSTDAIGNRLKEASMINKSLLCLGHVINALVDKEHGKARHIPFRNSKLTFLLKDTWGGNSKTCLVATVSPSGSSQSETITTLTFAQRAKLIKNNAILNEDTCGTVAALQAEVAKLRTKLQESSSTIVERIVESEITTKNDEVILSMKRRSERAEIRVAELEKQISDEAEIVNTLKRKVQEETMVRKFKERRLDYMQRKDTASHDGSDDQIELLKAEINALQKRLNAPSEDAIGWRVAYEEAREALEKKLDEDGNDYAELEEKKSLLEETVDRLCGEKFELERKITELSESSNETRKEIESIMNEVDALEREMVNCQEQLNVKNDQCREFESRANDAESQLEKVKATNESASVERELLENQVSKLQASVSEYSQNMTKLTKTSEEKNKDLLEMESLVIEKEKELQYVIDELRKELKETNSTLSEKDGTIRDLEKRLCSASEENQNLSAQIKEAISEVNRQKIQIVAMEEKIKLLAEEKDSTVQSIEKENSRNIAEFTRKIESLEEKVVELSSEKDGLESKLSHMKQHVELSSGNLVENRADIESLESQLSEMSEVHAAAEKSMEAQSSELNGKFCSATERVEVLSAKIAVVEAERHTAVRNIEEERDLMASNLGHEIDGLQRNLAHSVEEKEVLRGKLSIIDTKEVELKSTIECLMDAVQNADASLQAVEEESKATMDTAVLETEERERRLTEHASELEIERDELLEEIYEMNEELRTIVEENMDLHGQIQFSDSQIESLKSDIVRAEEAQLESTHVFEDKLNRIVDECNHMTKLKNKFELELKEKQNEIARMLNESATQRRALDDAYSKVQESLNAQEKLRMSQHDASLADTGTIQTLTLAKEDLEAEILHCRKEIEELKSIEYSRKQEILGLQETANKFEGDAKDALSKLARTEEGHESIENVHKSLLRKKDVKIGEIKSKFSSLENDCSTLRKQIELMTTSANEFEGKHNRLQDRFTLLQREKGNLEFELDTMQEDQNALSDQVRVLGDQNHELQSENERLQSVINDMKNGDNQSLKSDAISSSGSTWNSDSRLSYETLTTNMDNMLEDMLENISKKKEDTNITSPEEHMSAKNDLEGGDLDDSFDESMFLPNVEDQVAPQDAPADPPVNKRVDKESEKENKSIAILGDENIESNKTKSSLSFCATPSKVNDYGKRRVPLSDRKNRTPLSTQSKRLRLSSRKVITSSKKSRTNYMFIDNTQLFG